jgi:polysaccharide pyruvyl transferase WcaK-like protein
MTRDDRDLGAGGQTPLRIGFFGELGSGNWGNDAGLDVIAAMLGRNWPDAELGFMSMGSPAIAVQFGWPVVPLQWYEGYAARIPLVRGRARQALGRALDVVRIIRWARSYDLVVIPGAGVLEDTTPVRPWGVPLNLLLLGVGARLGRTRLAYVAVGASVPPPGLARQMFSWAARLAHYRSYRDDISLEAARELGVRTDHDKVFADLAFALDPPEITATSEPRVVTVGVMNYRGRAEDRARATELHNRYRDQVERFVGHAATLGWHVVLVTGDREDVAVAQRIRSRVLEDHPEVSVRDATVGSMDELMRVLGGSRCVVASRFHNVLGALALSIPTISLSYAAKNDSLMERMGLGDLCQRIDLVDEERLVDQFRRVDAEHDLLSATIVEARGRECLAAQAQLVDLSEVIQSVAIRSLPH